MKRAAACLLALCMAIQGPAGLMTSYADFGKREVATPPNVSLASPSDAEREYEKVNGNEEKTGELDIEIRGVLPVKQPTVWEVFLKEDGMEVASESIQIEAVETPGIYSSGSHTFTGLPKGDYEILVKELGNVGYEDYTQKIKVNGDRSSIILLNDYPESYNYSGNNLPGVIRMGDVNGDSQIDEFDLEELIDRMNQEDTSYTNPSCDLNKDGETNLTDLQYFTRFYKNGNRVKASVTKKVIVESDAIIASASNATFDEETLKEVFTGNNTEKLAVEAPVEITPETPVEITADLGQSVQAAGFTIQPVTGSGHTIKDGLVTVAIESDGQEKLVTFEIKNGVASRKSRRMARSAFRSSDEDSKAGKTIVIDLGSQVAIKKVTIKVTATLEEDAKLVEISKVEFLNNMEDRIPEPDMNIPKDLQAVAGSESFGLTWKREVNITGYEVEVTGEVKSGIKTTVIKSDGNNLEVKSLENEDLINDKEYTVRVQSVNGEWKSGYGEALKVIPLASKQPDPPEGVTVKSGYRSLSVSWQKMKNTDYYSLYYREYDDVNGEYKKINNIENTSQKINDLKSETKYDIYLTGTNKIGEGRPSNHYTGTTESLMPPITPNYKLINVPGENGGTQHIQGVNNNGGNADSQFAIVDNDTLTAWVRNDWDAGCIYPDVTKSPVVTLDQQYTMDTVIIIPDPLQPYDYPEARFFYWPEGSRNPQQAKGSLRKKTSSNNKIYYEFQTAQPITTDKVQVRLTAMYGGSNRISIAEMKFYQYDSLEHDIYGLFADDMHLTIKEGVTQDTIDVLKNRLEQKDTVSGEFHPKKFILTKELATAEKIFNDGALSEVVVIDNKVTKSADGNISFSGGLNAWQPLSAAAMAGDTVLVYVGSPDKKTGDNTNLRLIGTQYYGESSAWHRNLGMLKIGVNEITIPKITDLDVEHGGQLYVEYTGTKGREKYSVRVSGESYIPTLDITKASDANAARAMVTEYVKDLETRVPGLETEHGQHSTSQESWVNAQRTCILGATDIVTRFTMSSVSSLQVLAGLSGNTTEEKAEQLYQSLLAFDEMTKLFYQHKGLSDDPKAGDKNKMPTSRLNLRYQRMFAGAFMYAGGLHMGIEWDSIPGLTQGVPIKATPEGKYISGNYFGWGISHEFGHEINEGAYAIAEITNNYFALLAEAQETNSSIRFSYPDVYKKVTSNVVGRSSDVFTQLGLYWQLHLAYDMGGYNFKTYDTYKEQFANLFFARVDSYVRAPGTAPKPGGVALSLNGDVDNKLMRLACAAAEKNILEFFVRWGMVPNEETKRYAEQFSKETRAIWFVNDEARAYVMENGKDGSIAADTAINATLNYADNSNEVTITLGHQAAKPEAMLGYEIYRSENIKSRVIRKPVGFVTADKTKFVDSITTINNRVFTYEVIGYDKYLNATSAVILDPVKVSHGGVIDKTGWTVTTNMSSDEDQMDEDSPDAVIKKAIKRTIDGDVNTTYKGRTEKNSSGNVPDPFVTIHLNKEETITGLSYGLSEEGNPIKKYKVEISKTGESGSWTKIKEGTFTVTPGGNSQTVYFNKPDDTWLYAYDTSYVKITALSQKGTDISISEFSLIGQTGDNIDFAQTDSIGLLKEDYVAGQGDSGPAVIPAKSLIFTGTYKGNPAFNVVLLYDENGKIVGGADGEGNILSEQIIFAEVPEHGELGEVSSGTWIYYITPDNLANTVLPKRVRAELYRVGDAQTNEGERLVSNTLFVEVPEKLPEITIKADTPDGTYRRSEHVATTNE